MQRDRASHTWHRRNTTTMCLLWVIAVMAADIFGNVWAFMPLYHPNSEFCRSLDKSHSSDISRPLCMMSHAHTPTVSQVWVIENDLPPVSHMTSTSCTIKLHLQLENSEWDWCQRVSGQMKKKKRRSLLLYSGDRSDHSGFCGCGCVKLVIVQKLNLPVFLTSSRSLQTQRHGW